MRLYKTIIPAVASVMLLAGCDDQIMQWGRGADQGNVTAAELPLEVKEVLANYEDIKTYTAQYMPNTVVGIGMGAPMYVANENGEGDLANANFQMFTAGNAMKHDAIVAANGSLNFGNVDALVENLKSANMKLYGHNFFWHTQQQQNYLKSLVAPEMVVVSDGEIENIVTNSDFEDGTASGYQGFWCDYTYEVSSPGHNSDKCLHITTGKPTNMWDAQLFWGVNGLEEGVTYAYSFYAKSDCNLEMQFLGSQSESPYEGLFKDRFNAGSDWTHCQGEFTYDGNPENIGRVGIQFGGVAGANLWIDDFEFGKKKEGPTNYCNNGSFENGTEGWTLQNKSGGIEAVDLADAINGGKVLKMVANESASNAWDLQVISPEMPTMPGKKVQLSFYVKSDQPGKGRVSFNDALSNKWPWMNWTGKQDSWTESFETSTGWTFISVVLQNFSTDFVEGAAKWQFNLDFGYIPGVTYYIDDVQVIEYDESASAPKRATSISFKLKSADEKREALEGAMESWVKGMADHLAELGIVPYGYDVINEPISDGGGVRGYDGVFGGTWQDGDATYYDAAPEESETDGLNLNWGSGHWYWGYYVPDYPVKAFQLARKYLPAETKLFVNDYNLETSPGKLQQLCDFVAKIDADNGSAIVDGIGTQMHISLSCSDDAVKNAENIAALKEKVDAMFKTMAATGKLVRVTELDIALGTGSPSSAQYQAQADCYRMIVESFKANVPEAQQSGITIWSLSDNEVEHEYWLTGEKPNLFDADYLRKWSYKGFCDGIAGEDLGLKYGGEDYKAFYEKNNVSSTVK